MFRAPDLDHAHRQITLYDEISGLFRHTRSAVAERIFSALKGILEVVGSTPLEDDVECRVLAQMNKRLSC